MKKEQHLSPINIVFFLIATAPYLGVKFGYIPATTLAPIFLWFSFKSYKFYKQRSLNEDISYTKALERDLPDMSPIHFFFFILIAAPIFLIIVGWQLRGLVGIGILFIAYTIYYYGFRERSSQ